MRRQIGVGGPNRQVAKGGFMDTKTLAVPKYDAQRSNWFRQLRRQIWQHRIVYLLLLPGLLFFLVFKYGALYNAQIAFKNFLPGVGVEGSPWIGTKNFEDFFKAFYFKDLMFNTLLISVLKLIFGIPPAIILALALSETRFIKLGRIVQTV